jgi:hypothetical protein
MVMVIYLPMMIAAVSQPELGIKVEGINYFFDTLLFAGTILALASASPRAEQASVPASIANTASATGTEPSAQD